MGRKVTIPGKDGSFSAYVAEARKPGGPAIVVIQEIFGVNQVLRDITDSLAEEGYTAVCPDLFWRIQPGIDITDKTDAEWEKAFSYFKTFNVDKGVDGFVSKDSQAKMKAGLTASNFQLYSYPGRDHAFARDGGKHYHAGDARKANARTMKWFETYLG